MTFQPIPVQRFLVPDRKPAAPEGFIEVSEAILGGLPHRIDLDQDVRLLLFVPTGLASTWRDADPTALVTESAAEIAPRTGPDNLPIAGVTRAPARIAVQIAGATVASIPLTAGLTRTVPDAGDADRGSRLEIVVLAWDIRAGSLRGPGDFGSRITLAWRRADRAVENFSTPPVSPQLVPRLAPEFRMQSELGRIKAIKLARFQIKKVFLR